MKKIISLTIFFILIGLALKAFGANTAQTPSLSISLNGATTPQNISNAVKLLILLTALAIAPSFLIMLTSFTRIIIVLSILRQAMGLQQEPPNQILLGIALFLTIFIMSPTISAVYNNAYKPFNEGKLTLEQAYDAAQTPIKAFMLKQTRQKDIALFLRIAKQPNPPNSQALGLNILVPAFIISELKTAFEIGFLLYIPFVIIDIVVSSVLMSMGMMMLPPIMISLPFKLLLFVLADGWNLVVLSLVKSFH